MSNKTFLLIDCHNLCWRGYWHLSKMENSRGENVGMELGFFNSLLRLVRQYQTMELKLLWDGECIWKKSIDPIYKKKSFASKEEEAETLRCYLRIQKLREICRNLCDTFYDPTREADEIAGALSRGLSLQDQSSVLWSSDEDWFQLVEENVKLVRPTKFGDELLGVQDVIERVGITPSQYPWYKALAGCDSDGVPGIPRMRRDYIKTAIRETNATFFDDWSKLLEFFRIKYPNWYKPIESLEKRLLLNFKLVNLRNLSFSFPGSIAEGDTETVIDFCRELELHSLVNKREWSLFKSTKEIPGFYCLRKQQ